MKTNTILLMVFLIGFNLACKKKQKTDEVDEKITIKTNSEEEIKSDLRDDEKSGDCEDFMDEYEKWMEEYVALMGKYKEDPVGLASSPEYASMSMEMINWASKWSDLAMDCARYPGYEKRFNEIQEKAEREMEELGIK